MSVELRTKVVLAAMNVDVASSRSESECGCGSRLGRLAGQEMGDYLCRLGLSSLSAGCVSDDLMAQRRSLHSQTPV